VSTGYRLWGELLELEPLSQRRTFARLTRLDIGHVWATQSGLRALASAAWLDGLDFLHVTIRLNDADKQRNSGNPYAHLFCPREKGAVREQVLVYLESHPDWFAE
jgi:hypothetical protein